jgi:hypothetical protein
MDGVTPQCYGASRQCFPSGMSRSMGAAGLRIYKLELGRHARLADLVDLFDEGPDLEVSSVEEQERFYEDWLAHFNPQWTDDTTVHP